jgi:methylmalonyl-CoA/ethylmalonyl-CoA epimerase
MPGETTSPNEMFSDLVQIGVVVRDLDRTIKVLADVFGLGPFRTITYPPADRKDIQRVYRGEPADFAARMAFTELGPVELELLQPLDGESIWADFLKTHGEGIHHIRFNVPELEPVIEYLAERGVEVAQWASALRPGTSAVNFDTEDKIGFTIEILNPLPGTDGRTPQIVDGKVEM